MSTAEFIPPKPVQCWQANDYAHKGRFVSDLAHPVVDSLAPKRGERILDLGCGDGVLTHLIAASGADVLGAVKVAPWFFPSIAGYRRRSSRAASPSNRSRSCRVQPHSSGMQGSLETFGCSFFEQFAEPERSEVFAEMLDLLRPALCDADGVWTADHIRLRFAAEPTK
jgi:hypothetical protein